MALYEYKKRPVKFIDLEPESQDDVIIIKREKAKRITLWDILFGAWTDFKSLIVTSKVAGIMLPVILIFAGVMIIFRQLWPEVEQKIKLVYGYYDTNTVALVEGDYVDRAKYLSDPGASYFKQLSSDVRQAHVLDPDPTSNNFRGRFVLSIPALDLYKLPVQANVESGVEDVYQSVLVNGLAHFKDTGLPLSEVNNNTVIYGHSSSGDYYERTKDPAGAFSRLNQIKVGDEIEIEMEGKTYKYRVVRSKIVQPNDISIIAGTPGQDTLTLFTCFPNGNNAQRFVAIAKPI